MPDNLYNTIPYSTFPKLHTHPDRLAAVGTLLGMTPAPVTRCRLLEVGCGNASNLIPMAYGLPESRFTGVDLAGEPIAAGRQNIAALGLENISLEVADLLDIGAGYGEFDYIVAHGLYSWIPTDVRDRLLALCRERLAPQGIAFVSYNAMPGRHVRQMLREMMLYHTRNIQEPVERVKQARWFLEFLLKARIVSPPWQTLLDHEIQLTIDHGEGGLFHDDLSQINDAVYFRDFASHAARHGLQYLGEADPNEMFDPLGSLTWLEGSVTEREQYLDFIKARRFRQTLLCHQGVALHRDAGPAGMDRFLFTAPARNLEGGQIEGLHGVRITAVHDAVRRVTGALGDAYPLPLAFEELLPYAGDDRDALSEILFGLMIGGFADIHVYDFPCEETVTPKPRASRLARHQARLSAHVTNACHHVIELDDMARRMVCLLDGSRDHEQVAQSLAEVPGAPPLEDVRRHLPGSLQWMAKMGLLEA